jgi:hypothetical protein
MGLKNTKRFVAKSNTRFMLEENNLRGAPKCP